MNIHELSNEDQASYYLDYVNNFLTVGGFADYYHLDHLSAKTLIRLGKQAHEGN